MCSQSIYKKSAGLFNLKKSVHRLTDYGKPKSKNANPLLQYHNTVPKKTYNNNFVDMKYINTNKFTLIKHHIVNVQLPTIKSWN